jgi:hypothetical protein
VNRLGGLTIAVAENEHVEANESNKTISACMMSIRSRASGRQGFEICRCLRVWKVEFPSAVEANLVCPVFDREQTAEVPVAASKHKLENIQEQFHKSWARWRRSQLPLATSHSSKDRTLARARAIEQSAAP